MEEERDQLVKKIDRLKMKVINLLNFYVYQHYIVINIQTTFET